MVIFHLHFTANRYWVLCLELLKKYYTAKLRAQGISLNIGLSGLIEAHGARDRAESTKYNALYRLRFMRSPLSQRSRNTRHSYDAHAHEQRARAWPERPPSLSRAKGARLFAATCSRLRASSSCTSGSIRRKEQLRCYLQLDSST